MESKSNVFDYQLVNSDTDSIMISKRDGSAWSKEEKLKFLEGLNSQFPEKISWEDDGEYSRVVVVKSKNYALLPIGETKIKTKGSSIRDQKKEPALREMMDRFIKAMIDDKQDQLVHIYHEYIREAMNVQDIKRWASKKTVTASLLDCKGWTQADVDSKKLRMNEIGPWEAIKNEEGIQSGDKVYLYPAILSQTTETKILKSGKPGKPKITKVTGLKLTKYFTNDHDCDKLLERVYKTVCIFSTVLDMKQFINYSLVNNKALLGEL